MTINERERLYEFVLRVILEGKPEPAATVVDLLQVLHEEERFKSWAKRAINLQYGAGHTTNTKDIEETSDTRPELN